MPCSQIPVGSRAFERSDSLRERTRSLESRVRRASAEQLVNRIIRPLGLVVLTRERIQEVLDDAASRVG